MRGHLLVGPFHNLLSWADLAQFHNSITEYVHSTINYFRQVEVCKIQLDVDHYKSLCPHVSIINSLNGCFLQQLDKTNLNLHFCELFKPRFLLLYHWNVRDRLIKLILRNILDQCHTMFLMLVQKWLTNYYFLPLTKHVSSWTYTTRTSNAHDAEQFLRHTFMLNKPWPD